MADHHESPGEDGPLPPVPPQTVGIITSLGPELFTNGDVIAYKGENYYRACYTLVTELTGGGATHCVKRVGHPSADHEDYFGSTRYG